MDTIPKIKVLIVDDHDMVRRGLAIMLEAFNEFVVVGTASDARTALTLCARRRPDVVLMDLLIPSIDGVTATRLIHEKFPNTALVALTSSADAELVDAALKAGAVSYLLKTGSIDEVAKALLAAHQGKSILAPEALNVLISSVQHPQQKPGYNLTAREREVLSLMAEGLSNRAIAERLNISKSTVKNHIVNIYSKLEIGSRTKAVALAARHQLLAKD